MVQRHTMLQTLNRRMVCAQPLGPGGHGIPDALVWSSKRRENLMFDALEH